MADDKTTQNGAAIGERFPRLKQLEEDVERAKLDQALAEARAKTVQAKLPSLDVDLAKEAVAVSETSTGIARVLVQMDSIALADDIADLALDAARRTTGGHAHSYVIRVTGDRSVLAGIDAYRLLDGQLRKLEAQIEDYAPAQKAGAAQPAARALPLVGVAAAAGLAVQAFGLASKLFAHDYQISGREVAVDDLGFDLEVAHRLTAKEAEDEDVTVEVERLKPTPKSTKILARVWKLATETEQRLSSAINEAGAALARADGEVDAAKGLVTALNAEIVELTKAIPSAPQATTAALGADLDRRMSKRQELEDRLPDLEGEAAEARGRYERGVALRRELEELLTAALAARPGGGRPPALEAVRVEELAVPGQGARRRFLLYTRLIAGGIDQTIETKMGPDHFRALAGTSAEFALFDSGGHLLTSGVRSVLQGSTMKLDDAGSFHQVRPNYTGVDRRRD